MANPTEAHASAGSPVRWSSSFTLYLSSAGAAVGLGSIWRFPYLAGTNGGCAFIVVFVLACTFIAIPFLVAELALGRNSQRSPPEAAGEVARRHGLSTRWNAIGIMGSFSAFLIFTYYTVIAGWVLAYTWKCATGLLSQAGPQEVPRLWSRFLASPFEVGCWHLAFLLIVAFICARGVKRGIEIANKIRAPALLALLCILVGYSLKTGDVSRGLSFAFRPDFTAVNGRVILAAVGQAFFATGVGQGMIMAYGAYAAPGMSLFRTAVIVSASILLVSLLATLMIFPMVFHYGMDPAQGSQLVFEVLPRVFAEMPGGRLVGSLFFLLLTLAALIPATGVLEPAVAWLVQRFEVARGKAVWLCTATAWVLGIGSVLSFNLWAGWHPLGFLPGFAAKTYFDVLDYVTANFLGPIGALLTSLLLGWRITDVLAATELAETNPIARRTCIWALRYLCPIALFAVFATAVIA